MLKFTGLTGLILWASFYTQTQADELPYTMVDRFPGLTFDKPLLLVPADVAKKYFVVEQKGKLVEVDDSVSPATKRIVLDIQSQVACCGETGFLGFALSPHFDNDRLAFLSYTTANPLRSIVSKIEFDHTARVFIPSTEKKILEVAQPYSNHNGGNINFGPDKMLYLGLGDGGSGGDPNNNAQNLNTLLGKMLRLDVLNAVTYSIPSDNPFVGRENARGEIWAYGLRNPWRWSFDSDTGKLWAGDVGQNAVEEVDIINKGDNLGWRIFEGKQRYNPTDPIPPGTIFRDPIYTYTHADGGCITGGYVYRGTDFPALTGQYIFGDYSSGKIYALEKHDDDSVTVKQIAQMSALASFGRTETNELVAINISSGKILKFKSMSRGFTMMNALPEKLSETGLFSSLKDLIPSSDLIPFKVNQPLWSDGADKRRWIRLPEGSKVSRSEDGKFVFPTGAVLVKDFESKLSNGNIRRLEVRLALKTKDDWEFGSYVWNDDLAEALLKPDGAKVALEGEKIWEVPTKWDCARCHNASPLTILGFKEAQFSRSMVRHLNRQNVFERPLSVSPSQGQMRNIKDRRASLGTRTKSYLDANCSHCHNPEGPANTDFDLRFQTPFNKMKIIDVAPNQDPMGLADPKIIKPFKKEESVLWLRMHTRGPMQMPILATKEVDELATKIIGRWIDRGAKAERD